MTDNLKLWQSIEKTPKDQTKSITGKSYSGTSPKPHYLVHKATETFGPCGIGWGFQIVDERIEEGAGGERLSIARVKVWYEWEGRRGEVEHIGGTQFSGTRKSGQPFTDEDAPKKSVTDALVKALSMIGFAGDIFMGRYDDSKYVRELEDEARQSNRTSGGETLTGRETGAVKQGPAPVSPPLDMKNPAHIYVAAALKTIGKGASKDDLRDWWDEEKPKRDEYDITKGTALWQMLFDAMLSRKDEIEAADLPAGQLEAAE